MATEIITTRALTNLARMKLRLGIDTAGFDTLFERMIMSVTDELESRANRKFGQATYTNEVYTIYHRGTEMFSLNNTPVTALSALQYRAGTPSNPSWTSFIADEYELVSDGKAGLIRIYGGVPSGTNAIRATYTAGYKIDFEFPTDTSKHTLPFDLTDLAERLITKRFKKREHEGKENESFEGGQVTWEKFLTADDREILARYTRLPVFI